MVYLVYLIGFGFCFDQINEYDIIISLLAFDLAIMNYKMKISFSVAVEGISSHCLEDIYLFNTFESQTKYSDAFKYPGGADLHVLECER